eukprot:PhM_4_TR3674/c0_g1_i1/m.26211/K00091/E1.1.1.219; dihydroflavonol-4-reductase
MSDITPIIGGGTIKGAIVLGATGFLGSHVCQQLSAKGVRVTAIVRPTSTTTPGLGSAPSAAPTSCPALSTMCSSIIHANVSKSVLEEVLDESSSPDGGADGINVIFHLVGAVHHSKDKDLVGLMHRANVVVTNMVLEVASRRGIPVVYASTSGVVGIQRLPQAAEVADDDSAYCHVAAQGLPYYEQKIYIEELWRPKAQRGDVDVVFMRPSLLLGPGDRIGVGSTNVVRTLLHGEVPFCVPGGVSVVDVRDAAAAFIRAAELRLVKAIPSGSTFLLTAANMSHQDFCVAAAAESNGRCTAPTRTLPMGVAHVAARVLHTLCRVVLRQSAQEATKYDEVWVEMGARYWNVCAAKAQRVLGFAPRDLSATLRDTIDDIVTVEAEHHHQFGRHGGSSSRFPVLVLAVVVFVILYLFMR